MRSPQTAKFYKFSFFFSLSFFKEKRLIHGITKQNKTNKSEKAVVSLIVFCMYKYIFSHTYTHVRVAQTYVYIHIYLFIYKSM